MPRRKREFGPESQNKLVMTLASTYAARMGPVAESPLGGFIVAMSALQTANKWYSRRTYASEIYKRAVGYLGRVEAFERAKVNALASAASKVVIRAHTGKLVGNPVDELDAVLNAVKEKVDATEEQVQAVKRAALIYLAQQTAGGA